MPMTASNLEWRECVGLTPVILVDCGRRRSDSFVRAELLGDGGASPLPRFAGCSGGCPPEAAVSGDKRSQVGWPMCKWPARPFVVSASRVGPTFSKGRGGDDDDGEGELGDEESEDEVSGERGALRRLGTAAVALSSSQLSPESELKVIYFMKYMNHAKKILLIMIIIPLQVYITTFMKERL